MPAYVSSSLTVIHLIICELPSSDLPGEQQMTINGLGTCVGRFDDEEIRSDCVINVCLGDLHVMCQFVLDILLLFTSFPESRTCNLWDALPQSCLSESYNLSPFKSKIIKFSIRVSLKQLWENRSTYFQI